MNNQTIREDKIEEIAEDFCREAMGNHVKIAVIGLCDNLNEGYIHGGCYGKGFEQILLAANILNHLIYSFYGISSDTKNKWNTAMKSICKEVNYCKSEE